MSRINTSEFAVLGLLALGARTGYDIRRECEEKLSHFWSESYGQIYPVLRALHERGWVERTTIDGPGPRKHAYELTREGTEALRNWIARPPSPLRVRNELLLKVFLGRLVGPETLLGVLAGFEERARAQREVFAALRDAIRAEADHEPDAPLWLLTLDFGIRSLEAQIRWAEEARRELDRVPSGAESGRS